MFFAVGFEGFRQVEFEELEEVVLVVVEVGVGEAEAEGDG